MRLEMSSPRTQCDYFGRNGPCGRTCYAGRCFKHWGKKTLAPCLVCGVGTGSASGYCHTNCTNKQIYYGSKLKRERDEKDAQMKRDRDEMDADIDYLLSLDWADPQCHTPLKTLRVVECATSG